MNGFIEKDGWTEISEKSLSYWANIIGGRFVLTLKNPGTQQKTEKSRIIAQGCSNSENPFMWHDAAVLRPT